MIGVVLVLVFELKFGVSECECRWFVGCSEAAMTEGCGYSGTQAPWYAKAHEVVLLHNEWSYSCMRMEWSWG